MIMWVSPFLPPQGVGFKVGGETGSKYFVLQVHYGDIGAFQGM